MESRETRQRCSHEKLAATTALEMIALKLADDNKMDCIMVGPLQGGDDQWLWARNVDRRL